MTRSGREVLLHAPTWTRFHDKDGGARPHRQKVEDSKRWADAAGLDAVEDVTVELAMNEKSAKIVAWFEALSLTALEPEGSPDNYQAAQ